MPSIGCGWGYCGPVEPLGWKAQRCRHFAGDDVGHRGEKFGAE